MPKSSGKIGKFKPEIGMLPKELKKP